MTPSDHRHRFRVCPIPDRRAGEAASASPIPGALSAGDSEHRQAHDDFGPLADTDSVPRLAATASAPSIPYDRRPESSPVGDESAEVGLLVHDLFKAMIPDDEATDAMRVREIARAYRLAAGSPMAESELNPLDRREGEGPNVEGEAIQSLEARAADLYVKMRSHPEVAAVLRDSDCLFEVPFSFRLDQSLAASLLPEWPTLPEGSRPPVIRGRIDCLARRPDGSVVVLDFKTGAPKPADRVQIAIYLSASRALYPGHNVAGVLVYPDRVRAA